MGTIKQRLESFVRVFKIDIKRINKKLFLAAVILFCLSFSLASPVKGIDQIFFPGFNANKPAITEQTQNESSPNIAIRSFNGTYLTANTLASLTIQPNSPNSDEQNEQNEPLLIVIPKNAILSQTSPITYVSQKPREDIITYVVQEGDTPSSIAASFGITLNTLLWANKLKQTSLIRPGDELIILPVSGILHKIKDNQTVGWIANYYKAKSADIIAFNGLPADGSIQIGQNLIIPDGQMPTPVQTRTVYTAKSSYSGAGTGKSRSFPYGQCTWYVAQKRPITWSGHAKSWLANARAAGYSTCVGSNCEPTVGAVVSLKENGWLARMYGHVAYVIKVEDNRFLVSEMNHIGWAKESVRWIPIGSYKIRGFIY